MNDFNIQAYVNKTACWGYEPNCKMQESYSMPSCPGEHRGWAKTKQEQFNIFYSQGDFGYVRDQMQEMMVMCEPLFKVQQCTKYIKQTFAVCSTILFDSVTGGFIFRMFKTPTVL